MSTDEAKRAAASELLASFKVEANADLVAQVAEHLSTVQAASGRKNLKFAFGGDGTNITISTRVSFSGVTIGPFVIAQGTSTKTGSGALVTTDLSVVLFGAYKLSLERQTAKLYNEDNQQIWIWKGEQTGLDGNVDVVFNNEILIALARAVVESGADLV